MHTFHIFLILKFNIQQDVKFSVNRTICSVSNFKSSQSRRKFSLFIFVKSFRLCGTGECIFFKSGINDRRLLLYETVMLSFNVVLTCIILQPGQEIFWEKNEKICDIIHFQLWLMINMWCAIHTRQINVLSCF